MKLYTFLIVLFFYSTHLMAQVQFVTEYNHGGSYVDDFQNDIGYMDQIDNGYVIGGRVRSEETIYPLMFTVDEVGVPTGLSKRYDIENFQSINAHVTKIKSMSIDIETGESGNGYLLSGIMDRLSNAGANRSSYFIKTDLSGEVVWTKRLRIEDEEGDLRPVHIRAVEQVSNESVIVVGTTGIGGGIYRELVIIKLNYLTGEIRWHEEISLSNSSANTIHPHGITEAENGNYYIYGDLGTGSHIGFVFHIKDNNVVPFGSPDILTNHEFKTFSISGYNGSVQGLVKHGNSLVLGLNTARANVGLFRTSYDLADVESLDGTTDRANTYFDENSYHSMKYLIEHNDRLVFNGDIAGSPGSGHNNTMVMVNADGSVLNSAFYETPSDITRGKNSFSEDNSFVIGTNVFTNKFRLVSYSTIGNSCDDESLSVSTRQGVVNHRYQEYTKNVRGVSYENINTTAIPHSFAVDEICADCYIDASTVEGITTSTGETTFCEGEDLTLFGPAGFVSYQWYNDGIPVGTGANLDITEGGNYSVICIDENGCEVEKSVVIYQYQTCTITNRFRPFKYCSIAYPSSSFIGWFNNPLDNCPEDYSFSWTYNGMSVDGHFAIGDWATEFVGPGIYEVTVTTPCGTQVFSQTVTDDLIIYVDHPYALSVFNGYSGSNATFKRFNPFPVFTSQEWKVYDEAGDLILTSTDPILEVPYPISGVTLTIELSLLDRRNCIKYVNTMTWSDGPSLRNNNGRQERLAKQFDQLQVAPNPASDFVNLSIPFAQNNDASYVIELYDVNGKMVKSLSTTDQNIQLDLSTFIAGLYLIKVSDGDQTWTTKLIKK